MAELQGKLEALEGCEIMPAKNRNILIVVTETNSNLEEQELQSSLKSIQEIQNIILTFGTVDPNTR